MPERVGIVPTGDRPAPLHFEILPVAKLFILRFEGNLPLYPWFVVFRELNREQRCCPFSEMRALRGLSLVGFFLHRKWEY